MKVAFEVAVAQHADTVLRVCRAVLGATTDADDAWSETFLAALQAWASLDDDTNVEAWLVRVAHRKAIDVVGSRSEEHTSELQSRFDLVCRLLLQQKHQR